jgi:hypothetical protein
LREKFLERIRIKEAEELAKIEEEKRRIEMNKLVTKVTRKKKKNKSPSPSGGRQDSQSSPYRGKEVVPTLNLAKISKEFFIKEMIISSNRSLDSTPNQNIR